MAIQVKDDADRAAETLYAKLDEVDHDLLERVLGDARATAKMLGRMGQLRAEERFETSRREEAERTFGPAHDSGAHLAA
jgi:hypothetical protein